MKPIITATALAAVAAFLTFVLTGAARPTPQVPIRGKPVAVGPIAVRISNFTFGPRVVTVKVGQTVTWTNDDDIPHTVVAIDKSFRSKVIDTGQSFSFTFTKPGQFAYFCSLHPMMTGKVTVTVTAR